MRLAILSDIHGNVVALEAVLADLEARAADALVNLGDCATGPLWPRETMDLLGTLSALTVRGNHDRWLTDGDAHESALSHACLTSGCRSALDAFAGRPDRSRT